MSNYNTKYTYTKFTRDILVRDESDKRLPEIKLASRWWDGIWLLGIERFCNRVSGTTEKKEQRMQSLL